VAERSELTAQSEDYLEAIFDLGADTGAARPGDIAGRLGVHKSTVTGALHSLAEKGLVNYAPYEAASLTAEGERLARAVARRHEAVARFLGGVLQFDDHTAQANACRIEHAVDPQVIDRLLRFVDFLEGCPRFHEQWHRTWGAACDGADGDPPCDWPQADGQDRAMKLASGQAEGSKDP
jgi:DtxR family Mn-dependent transcriptional regulator